jgi:hypothetical protein
MRKYLLTILGAVSICCFVSTSAMASSKHSKKSSKTRGTTECTTRGTNFTPAYATMVYNESPSWITATTIALPFDSIQTARNITLDTTTTPNTFTLPKGVYSINFQLVVKTDAAYPDPIGDSVAWLKFTKMYLDFNNGSSEVSLDWALGHDASGTMMTTVNNSTWASISGSKIFSVGADNTVVKFMLERELIASGTGNIKFSSNLDFYSVTPENKSIRVSLHKIDGCNS